MLDTEIQTPVSGAEKPKSRFATDVLKLVSGATFAQVITVLASPILTRLYPVEAFGITALFSSITGILGVIVCLRYELSIMLPETDEEASNLLAVSLAAVFLVSLLTIPIVWLGGDTFLGLLKAPELGPYLWLVPPTIFVAGIFLALNYWNSRTKRFGRLSIARVSSSSIATATQLSAGFAGLASAGSLIGASLVGSTVATLVLGGQIWRDDRSIFRRSINWAGMLQGVKRHRKFPLFSTWTALLNNTSWQLPSFLLSAFFSSTVVGYYALGTRVLRLPMSLIGSALGQVFFQRASVAIIEGDLDILVERTFRWLVQIGLFPMLLLTIIGKDLFVFVFGAPWAEAGVYTQILSIWMFLWFISSPLTTLFSVLEKQEFGLKVNVVKIILRFTALMVGGLLGNARLAIMLFGLSGILVYGFINWAIMNYAGVPYAKILRILGENVLIFIPVGGVIFALQWLNLPMWVVLGIAGIASGVYYFFIYRTSPELRSMLSRKAQVTN